jgi:hypothetical protein
LGKIKRFELTPDVWSIDGGQLTPLKLKKKVVMENTFIYSIKSTASASLALSPIIPMKLKIIFIRY